MALSTISVLVENSAGVLSRVVGLITRRAYNIDSLAVGTTLDPSISRITIELDCDDKAMVKQITAQILKLPPVKTVAVLNPRESIKRELIMIKVNTTNETRGNIIEIANIFRARVIDVSKSTVTIEMTGHTDKIDAIIELLNDFGIVEIVRTGAVALHRGTTKIEDFYQEYYEEF